MGIQFFGNQSIPIFSKKKAVNENGVFDLGRVKRIQRSQTEGEYLVDFSRVSEKLFYFERLLNHALIK